MSFIKALGKSFLKYLRMLILVMKLMRQIVFVKLMRQIVFAKLMRQIVFVNSKLMRQIVFAKQTVKLYSSKMNWSQVSK